MRATFIGSISMRIRERYVPGQHWRQAAGKPALGEYSFSLESPEGGR